MKLSELDMHCDNCDIIDYCNNYEDTPPCSQPRFADWTVDKFKRLADSSEAKQGEATDEEYKNILIDDVYERGVGK